MCKKQGIAQLKVNPALQRCSQHSHRQPSARCFTPVAAGIAASQVFIRKKVLFLLCLSLRVWKENGNWLQCHIIVHQQARPAVSSAREAAEKSRGCSVSSPLEGRQRDLLLTRTGCGTLQKEKQVGEVQEWHPKLRGRLFGYETVSFHQGDTTKQHFLLPVKHAFSNPVRSSNNFGLLHSRTCSHSVKCTWICLYFLDILKTWREKMTFSQRT